jgi:hypothetical protein
MCTGYIYGGNRGGKYIVCVGNILYVWRLNMLGVGVAKTCVQGINTVGIGLPIHCIPHRLHMLMQLWTLMHHGIRKMKTS